MKKSCSNCNHMEHHKGVMACSLSRQKRMHNADKGVIRGDDFDIAVSSFEFSMSEPKSCDDVLADKWSLCQNHNKWELNPNAITLSGKALRLMEAATKGIDKIKLTVAKHGDSAH